MYQRNIEQELLDLIRNRYFGKYRGTVVGAEDPTSRGRLLVRIPAVLGEIEVWAMPCVPYAGEGVGFYSLPPSESGVWCEFEGGDLSYPIWVGCFWADGQLPDDSDQNIKIWKTQQLTLRMDDDANELKASSGSGSSLTITDGVVAESNQATHTIDANGITSQSNGVGKLEVASGLVSVNNGALEVS